MRTKIVLAVAVAFVLLSHSVYAQEQRSTSGTVVTTATPAYPFTFSVGATLTIGKKN